MSRYELNRSMLLKAIEYAEGINELAKKAKVAYQSIIDWKGGRAIPSPISCARIEKATDGKVKREDLLPDYPWHELS